MHDIVKREAESYFSGAPSAELLFHLRSCEHCCARIENMAAASSLLRRLRFDSAEVPSTDFPNKVLARIREQRSLGFWTIFVNHPRFISRMAIAGLFLAAVLGSYLMTQDFTVPQKVEALIGDHDPAAPSDDPQHMAGMLLRLASYDE